MSVTAYQETSVSTQNKGRLVVLLYDGAIKFLRKAIEEQDAGNLAARNTFLTKAQKIINELNAVLDMEAGGEVAQNLRNLYVFMNERLTQSVVKRDPNMIREVIKLMEELNQGWKAISR